MVVPTAEELLLPALKLTIKLGAQNLPEVTFIYIYLST